MQHSYRSVLMLHIFLEVDMDKKFDFWIDVVYTGAVILGCMVLFYFLLMSVLMPLVMWVVY